MRTIHSVLALPQGEKKGTPTPCTWNKTCVRWTSIERNKAGGEERGHVTKWRNLYLNPTTSKFCQFQKWHIYSLVSLSLFEQSVQHLPHGKRIWWNSLSLQVTMDDLHLTLHLFLSNLFFFNESTSKQPMKTCPLTYLVDCMINVLQTSWCHNLVECWIYRLCWDLDCKLLSVAL